MIGDALAQTVEKVTGVPSLWEFLASLPHIPEVHILAGLMLSGALGLVANWLVKWSKGEVGSLRAYLFRSNVRRSLLSVFMMVGTFLTAVMSGVFFTEAVAAAGSCVPDSPDAVVAGKTFVGWVNVLWVGATTGFGIDATINKGEREVWSADKRASQQVTPS
jgi:hypothetical protein